MLLRDAMNMGMSAFASGQSLKSCPLSEELREFWAFGWKRARRRWRIEQKKKRACGDYSAWPQKLPAR